MPIDEPIEPSLQLKFENEKLIRTIENCTDIELLRQIAIELLELHQKKSAIALWATKRAAEAEQIAFEKNQIIVKDIDS